MSVYGGPEIIGHEIGCACSPCRFVSQARVSGKFFTLCRDHEGMSIVFPVNYPVRPWNPGELAGQAF